jgi:hypothetical protein
LHSQRPVHEGGWQLDQSAAAALVIASPDNSAAPQAPLLSFSSHTRLPFDWQADKRVPVSRF